MSKEITEDEIVQFIVERIGTEIDDSLIGKHTQIFRFKYLSNLKGIYDNSYLILEFRKPHRITFSVENGSRLNPLHHLKYFSKDYDLEKFSRFLKVKSMEFKLIK